MSATPTNREIETLANAAAPLLEPASPRLECVPSPQPTGSGREALQALLAFSALHEQIRERRVHSRHGSTFSEDDAWQIEQFALDEVLQLVAERALAITGAEGVAIALAEGNAIVCRTVAGSTVPDPGVRLDPNTGFSGACLVSRKTVRCDDTETDSRVDAIACRSLGARSMVAVPLSAKDSVIGLVEAFSSEPYGFNDCDVRSLNLLAELILSALKPDEEDRLAEISQRVVARSSPALAAPQLPDGIKAAASAVHPVEANDHFRPSRHVLTSTDSENPRPGLGVVVALTSFAVLLGVALWWGIRRHTTTSIAKPQPATASVVAPARTQIAENPKADSIAEQSPSQDATTAEPASSQTSGAMPEVTGIRHWSSNDSSTVVIDLQDQVQYEAHRLTNPERIYFDLHDTKLGSGLSSKTIEVGDPLLDKIRVAQPEPGVTRVVLETKGASNFSVSLEPNPYRLVVEVRMIGAKPQDKSKVDLFGPANQPAEVQAAINQPPMVAGPARPLSGDRNRMQAVGSKLRIVLDAGHGGWDLGTVGRRGLLEKNLVLDIVARLGKLVENRLGAEVIYTRKGDDYVALEKRAEIANLSQASLFLSVHANYSDYPSARGVETYYTNTYSSVRARPAEEENTSPELQNINWTKVDIREKVQESRRFASAVQHSLYGVLAAQNPGLTNRGVKKAQYVVLTGTTMPAILAEVSFVSSPTDENNLQSSTYRQEIAEALYQGLARYAEDAGTVKMASASRKTR